MTDSCLHLVQCANHHKRTTRDIESPCPECGGQPINAYMLPTLLPTADELLEADDA